MRRQNCLAVRAGRSGGRRPRPKECKGSGLHMAITATQLKAPVASSRTWLNPSLQRVQLAASLGSISWQSDTRACIGTGRAHGRRQAGQGEGGRRGARGLQAWRPRLSTSKLRHPKQAARAPRCSARWPCRRRGSTCTLCTAPWRRRSAGSRRRIWCTHSP